MSFFLNYSWQRCRCIFTLFFHIVIFFWFNFWYVAKLFYLKIGKSSNSAELVVQMLFWNPWNQESAGRVYFNISREKPAHTPDTRHFQPLSCKLEWTNQKHFYCFLLKPIRDILAPGFPRALDLSPLHAQKSSGSRLINTPQPRILLRMGGKNRLQPLWAEPQSSWVILLSIFQEQIISNSDNTPLAHLS